MTTNAHSTSRLHHLCTTIGAACLSFACTSAPAPEVAPAPPVHKEVQPVTEFVPGPSPTEIKLAVNGRNSDLRQCYIAGTFKNSQLAGTVQVTFTIDRSGKVSEAKDDGSSLPDSEVVECVLGVFAKLEFEGGATTDTEVTYPVNFGGHG